jgi:hypothetical protein
MAHDGPIVDRDDYPATVAIPVAISVTARLAIASARSAHIPATRPFEVRPAIHALAAFVDQFLALVAPLFALLAGVLVVGLGIRICSRRRCCRLLRLLRGGSLLTGRAVRIATRTLAVTRWASRPLFLGAVEHGCTVFDGQGRRLLRLLLSGRLRRALATAGRLGGRRRAGCWLAILGLLSAPWALAALAVTRLLIALARTLTLRLFGIALRRLGRCRLLGILLAFRAGLRLLGLALGRFGFFRFDLCRLSLLRFGLLGFGFLRLGCLIDLLLNGLLCRLRPLRLLFALAWLFAALFLGTLLAALRLLRLRLLGILLRALARLLLRLLGLLLATLRLFAAAFFLRTLLAALWLLGCRLLGILLRALARLLLRLFSRLLGLLLATLRLLAAALFLGSLLAALRLLAFALLGVLALATRLLALLRLLRNDFLLHADDARRRQ